VEVGIKKKIRKLSGCDRYVHYLLGGSAKGEKLKQAPCPVRSPMHGSISQPQGCDLSRNQESDALPTEPPRISRYVHYLDCGDGFTGTYKGQTVYSKYA